MTSRAGAADQLMRNEVRLIGKIPAVAQEKELPSGDLLCTFRVAVPRDAPTIGANGAVRRLVDSLECVTWSARVRRSAQSWDVGDLVEVSGVLRRRFYKSGTTSASRVEVEVTSGRRLRRARA